MTKVIAVHTIRRTVEPGVAKTINSPARKPKTKEIAPGTVFVISDPDELKALEKAGAVRRPAADEKVSVRLSDLDDDGKQRPVDTARRTTTSRQDGGTTTQTTVFDGMTGKQTDAYLEENKIEAPKGWKDMKVADRRAWLAENSKPAETGAAALNADGQGVKDEAEGTATGDGTNDGGSDPLNNDTGLV